MKWTTLSQSFEVTAGNTRHKVTIASNSSYSAAERKWIGWWEIEIDGTKPLDNEPTFAAAKKAVERHLMS